MNTEKPLYLLAGGRGKSLQTTIANVRSIITRIGKEKPVIAFVGAASLKDNWLIYAILSMAIKAGCSCRIMRVVLARRNADIARARETLRSADAVLISGGDVEVGMQILKEKNMVGFLKDLAGSGKQFLGISAGSIMMSKGWVRWRNPEDDSTVELYSCLDLVPLYCDTHAEKDDWMELKAALKLDGDGTPGYGITSGALMKAYPDGRLEAEVGPVARYRLQDGEIVRQADLARGRSSSPDAPLPPS
jgi:peptidase E